jgi:hypothetical protein
VNFLTPPHFRVTVRVQIGVDWVDHDSDPDHESDTLLENAEIRDRVLASIEQAVEGPLLAQQGMGFSHPMEGALSLEITDVTAALAYGDGDARAAGLVRRLARLVGWRGAATAAATLLAEAGGLADLEARLAVAGLGQPPPQCEPDEDE